MFALTVLIAIVMAVVCFVVRPGRAVGLIIAAMLFWPEWMRFPIGLCQMSVPRFAALALLLRLTGGGKPRDFVWRRADAFVLYGWLWIVAANIIGRAESFEITYQIGRGLDTVLFYFIARLALRKRSDFEEIATPLTLCAIWMAIAGAVEAVTFHSMYSAFDGLSTNGVEWAKDPEFRWGMLRSQVSTGHSIYFGTAMAILAGVSWALRGRRMVGQIAILGAIAASIALFWSLSSGPQSALVMLLICNLYQYRTSLIRPSLAAFGWFSGLTELFSSRHFYYPLIDFISLASPNGWYRARLLDVAIMNWRDYWLLGVCGRETGWGPQIDGRWVTDVVNHFIIIALYGGLIAVGLYVASHVIAVRDAVRAWKVCSPSNRRLAFGLATTLVSIDVSSMSVGLFGPPVLLSSLVVGMLIDIDVKLGDRRRAPVPRPVSAAAGRVVRRVRPVRRARVLP